MERLVYDTPYSKIEIISQFNGLSEVIQPYLYSYAKISKVNKRLDEADAKLYIFDETNNKKIDKKIEINNIKHEIGITIDSLNVENQLLIKRLLINLSNRILESKGIIFIHASSVCLNNTGIMFIGDRGNGKTTNMLYMLENQQVKYVSNDRTGIKLDRDNGNIIMIGIPSRINIRPGTIEKNEELKRKLLPTLINRGYNENLKYSEENSSMKSRMILSIQELKDNLNTEERAFCNLRKYNIIKL